VLGVDGKPRWVRYIDPPALDPARYLALTRDSGTWIAGEGDYAGRQVNTGWFGYGKGLYINNPEHIKYNHDYERMRSEWVAASGTYAPDAVVIELDPHLVRAVTWEEDPEFMLTPDDAHQSSMYPMYQRLSWMNQAQSYTQPLRLRYAGLDRNATYILKATYGGRGKALVQLYLGGAPPADGRKFGDPVPSDPQKPTRHEFEVPKAMTADGVLDVAWDELGEGGAKIAEAWLIRKP
jgi:hypothetical protein